LTSGGEMKSLSDIKCADLEEYLFPGTDAAVLSIDEKIPQRELEEMFGELSGDHRFYPTEKGWRIKFPHWYVEELSKASGSDSGMIFEREEKGWDHEHCSFCHGHIG